MHADVDAMPLFDQWCQAGAVVLLKVSEGWQHNILQSILYMFLCGQIT